MESVTDFQSLFDLGFVGLCFIAAVIGFHKGGQR